MGAPEPLSPCLRERFRLSGERPLRWGYASGPQLPRRRDTVLMSNMVDVMR
jgi:hypothetical protein